MNQARTGGNANNNPAQFDVWSRFGLSRTDVAASFPAAGQNTVAQATINTNSRDYVFKNNPQVDITGPVGGTAGNRRLRLQLAVNTAQYGRTFQDRSHRFAIRTAPASIPANTPIYNVQVRGKRGNIVQVYPGVEYDFSPTRLTVAPGHVVHFQWTGSNTNPDNNAGQGKAGTDRSNIVVLHAPTYAEVGLQAPSVSIGQWANSYPYTNAVNASNFLGLSRDDLLMLGTQTGPLSVQFGGNIKQFDDCGTYFDLGPRVVGGVPGSYHYMSTRNNDFSNRGHKAMITVDPTFAAFSAMALAASGGIVQVTRPMLFSIG
jgi:plastocyanin